MSRCMKAAFLPGNSTVEMRDVPVPEPGHGEVLIAVKASTICGSDTDADHPLVLKATLDAVNNSKHVRASIYFDAELKSVSEQDAPGIVGFRKKLMDLIAPRDTHVLPHEQIIAKLDESGKLFRILVLKSTVAIPYTSVFFELDCGYWSREAEERLRLSIARRNP